MLNIILDKSGDLGKNKSRITLEVDGNFLTLLYSYETIVGFIFNGEKVVSENIWTHTTAVHLNSFEPDKKKRVSNDVMNEKLLNVLEKINYKV